MQTVEEQNAYYAKVLLEEERECILKFMLTGKPSLAPTEELMFNWCVDRKFIERGDEVNKYVITQEGLDHVQKV